MEGTAPSVRSMVQPPGEHSASFLAYCKALDDTNWFSTTHSGVKNQITDQSPNAWTTVALGGKHDYATCKSGNFGTGMCAGGHAEDCYNYDESGVNKWESYKKIRCDSLPKTVATLGNTKEYKCAHKGISIVCEKGSVVTSLCTSGGSYHCPKPNNECTFLNDNAQKGRGGEKGGEWRHYTVIECTPLVFSPPPLDAPYSGILDNNKDYVRSEWTKWDDQAIACPSDSVMMGACSSGKYFDCAIPSEPEKAVSHIAWCKKLDDTSWFKAVSALAIEEAGGSYLRSSSIYHAATELL